MNKDDFANQLARLQGMATVASSSNQRYSSDEHDQRRDTTNGIVAPHSNREKVTSPTWANRDIVPLMKKIYQALTAIAVDELNDKILLSAIHSAVEAWYEKQEWREDEADLARAILLRMEEEELKGSVLKQQGYIRLEAIDYVSVIHAFAKCYKSATAAKKAEDVLNHMDRRYKMGEAQFKPNRLAINTTIGAYAKSTQDHSPIEAERLLRRLETEYKATGAIDESVRPSTRSYGKVIDAWCRSKQKGAIKNAMVVLKRLELQFESGNIDTKPNTICYSTIIYALLKERGVNAATMAQDVFDSMLSHFEAGLTDFEPEEDVFAALIEIWIKSGSSERAEKAYQAFLQMKKYGLHGNTHTLNQVIDALAQRGDRSSLEEAESVLGVLESDPCLMTDYASYQCLLNAHIKNDATDQAEQLWKRWNQEYEAGHTDTRPEVFQSSGCSRRSKWAERSRLRHEAEIAAAAEANSIRFWREANESIGKKRKASEIAETDAAAKCLMPPTS